MGHKTAATPSRVLQQFEKMITVGSIPSVLILGGEETYFVQTALKMAIDVLLQPQEKSFNLHYIDGSNTSPARWLALAQTSPMMADRRVTVVRQCDKWVNCEKASKEDKTGAYAAGMKILVPYLSQPAGRWIMFLLVTSADRRKWFVKEAENQNSLFLFSTPKNLADATSFVNSLLLSEGLSFDPDVPELIAKTAGPDTLSISSEVEKLALYFKGRRITTQQAVEILTGRQDEDLFQLAQTVVARKLDRALQIIDRLWLYGASAETKVSNVALPLILLSLLEKQFYQLALVKQHSQGANFMSNAQLAQKAGIPTAASRFLVPQLVEASSNFSWPEIKNALLSIREADKKLKSTGIPPILILQNLVVSIVGKDT